MGPKKEKHKKRMKTATEEERDSIYRALHRRGRKGGGWENGSSHSHHFHKQTKHTCALRLMMIYRGLFLSHPI